MKRLPIIIGQLGMLILIGIGLWRFIETYKTIEVIVIPSEVQTTTSLGIIPMIIVSIVILAITFGLSIQSLVVFYEWFKKHKSTIMYPILLMLVGILQFIAIILETIKIFIETNSAQYIANLTKYITSINHLVWWIIGGVIFGLIGLGYSIIKEHFA